MKAYVLDTSALISLRSNEEGADDVEAILKEAYSKKAKVFISFMSFMEMYYCSWRAGGKPHALRTFLEMKMLPIQKVDASDELLFLAGEIKATCSLSLGDCWIAATALLNQATLVHKDPEFEQLQERISLKPLPYKN